MTFPRYERKFEDEPMFTAGDQVDHARETLGWPEELEPSAALVVYQPRFHEYILSEYEGRTIELHDMEVYALAATDEEVCVLFLTFGGPRIAAATEILVELGVETFLVLEESGYMQTEDGAIVCERAIRDEGTSYHYSAPSKYGYASESLLRTATDVLDDRGIDHVVGTSWSTDAIFRETREEVERYRDEGVLAVEMQVATLFVVAEYRGVDALALLAPSDYLLEEDWQPPDEESGDYLKRLLEPSLEILQRET